jgi:hypothetical protein
LQLSRRLTAKALFLEIDSPGDYGHDVLGHPQLWSAPVGNYLNLLPEDEYE